MWTLGNLYKKIHTNYDIWKLEVALNASVLMPVQNAKKNPCYSIAPQIHTPVSCFEAGCPHRYATLLTYQFLLVINIYGHIVASQEVAQMYGRNTLFWVMKHFSGCMATIGLSGRMFWTCWSMQTYGGSASSARRGCLLQELHTDCVGAPPGKRRHVDDELNTDWLSRRVSREFASKVQLFQLER